MNPYELYELLKHALPEGMPAAEYEEALKQLAKECGI